MKTKCEKIAIENIIVWLALNSTHVSSIEKSCFKLCHKLSGENLLKTTVYIHKYSAGDKNSTKTSSPLFFAVELD